MEYRIPDRHPDRDLVPCLMLECPLISEVAVAQFDDAERQRDSGDHAHATLVPRHGVSLDRFWENPERSPVSSVGRQPPDSKVCEPIIVTDKMRTRYPRLPGA
jgi:hypothetical protein